MIRQRPLLGIAQKVLSVLLVVVMLALIKAAGDIPLGQAMFYRTIFAMAPIVTFLALKRELSGALRTTRPLGHIGRSIVGLGTMGFTFYALRNLPLPETITLQYTQPLMVVIFSALFTGDKVRLFRWAAVGVGFTGVLTITWPSLSLLSSASDTPINQALGAGSATLAACCSAAAVLQIRELVRTERTTTMVLWFGLTASTVLLCTIPLGWSSLSFEQFLYLIAGGLSGGVGQLMMSESARNAQVSMTAPFEYTSIVFGSVLAYALFAELPSWSTLVGGANVILAGLIIIWRDDVRQRPDRGQVPTVPPP